MMIEILFFLSIVTNILLGTIITIVIRDYMKMAHGLERLYRNELYEKNKYENTNNMVR